MRSRFVLVLSCGLLALVAASAAQPTAGSRPIVAGDLVANPYEIVAVFRPVEQQAVAVLIGRIDGSLQSIVFKDARQAAAVFEAIWTNDKVVKDPGADDARPLTRMMLSDSERKTATLVANVDRLLAIVRDPGRRSIRVYMDRPAGMLLADPNTGAERPYLEIDNTREAAEIVLAAYKACVHRTRR